MHRLVPDADARASLPQTRAALLYAERLHAGQYRNSDGAAFITHPLEVGSLLYRAGAPDEVIAAGVLHDTLEKTALDIAALRSTFGSRIADLVRAVSEDSSIPGYGRRKAALRLQAGNAGPDALMIFAADKVSKVRELRATVAATAPGAEPAVRPAFRPGLLAHYRRCLDVVEQRLADSPLTEQLRTELAGLDNDLGVGRAASR